MTRRSLFGMLATAGGLLLSGGIALPTLFSGLSPALRSRRKEAWRPVGLLDEFPIRAVRAGVVTRREPKSWPRLFSKRGVFVWRRSESDLIVFSRSCTDLGCPLEYDAGSTCFFCPCHGGIFNEEGSRLAGPPDRPMYRYAHRVTNGVLEIDLSSVPAAA